MEVWIVYGPNINITIWTFAMAYEHPEDNNLRNLHTAMDYDDSGRAAVRPRSGAAISPTGDPGMPI